MDKPKMQTTDGVQDNINKIAELFPECITECKEMLTGGGELSILTSYASCCLPIL